MLVGTTTAVVALLAIGVAAGPADRTTSGPGAGTPVTTAPVPPTIEVAQPFAEAPPESTTAMSPTTTIAPTTTIDPDVMCRAAFADPDEGAAFNACSSEQFDRLQPSLAPGRLPRIAACQAAARGPACDGITPTTARPPTTPVPTAPPATVPTTPVGRTYRNCDAMHVDFPHGVGRPGAVDSTPGTPVTSFAVDAAVYAANSGSDRDGDGIACEKK